MGRLPGLSESLAGPRVRAISENARPSAASAFDNVDGEPQRLRDFFFAAELSHVFDRQPKNSLSDPIHVLAIAVEFLRLTLSDLAKVNDLVFHFIGPFLLEGPAFRQVAYEVPGASLSEKSEVRLEAITDARWQPAGRGVNEAVVE
jgi:hypothetical protein